MAQEAISPCPVCGGLHADRVSNIDGKTGKPLIVLQCLNCGLGYVDPLPTDEELQVWYTKGYREEYKSSFQPQLRHVLRAGRMAQDRWRWLCQNVAPLEVKRSLDIGASSGEFVYLLQSRGVDANGLEPHEGYSAYGREKLGLAVRTGSLQDWYEAVMTEERFELISMFHVFEHLVNPIDCLLQMKSLLNANGVIYIEVPNAIVMCAPSNIFFRAHTLYLTRNSLLQTLRKAGLEMMALNGADEVNLRVVARPVDGLGSVVHNDHQLATSARARTWPNYLRSRLFKGQVLKKMHRRLEEKETASRFSDTRELLDSLFKENRIG